MSITNGSVADVAIVWAATDDGMRGFIVPTRTPGFSATHSPQAVAAASITSELVLDDVRLPADAMLPEARASGGRCLSVRGAVRHHLGLDGRGAVGLADRARVRHAAHPVRPPDRGIPVTQAKLVDIAVKLHKGSCCRCTWVASRTASGCRPEQVSFGKLNNAREAIKVCRVARTILGSNGISLEYPVIRHMVNLESVLTYEGTPEMHQLVLGQAFTGSDAFR